MCLLGGGGRSELLTELTREWMSDHPKQPWLLFLADRADDFLSLCCLEHERTWIERMFASLSDHAIYNALLAECAAEGAILDARRRRARIALVHGKPVAVAVVESVQGYAEFTSGTALYIALEAFVDGTDPKAALAERIDEFNALQAGKDAATYWRERIAAEGWPLP
ncbi:hypothetical protein [Agrococcus terreus]|uniref:Nucleotidyl transferase AbiEii toxin, Type IV TA system n=1 Tax=Agrococcus terreus TaxID=574649 RepID=A0ABQ2KLA8_9MICO|nr:hypothetical protein [Agrococcus terreus]GGN85801.1 hypothetical protein GCM10010968_19000 [Agrococcus terreus]